MDIDGKLEPGRYIVAVSGGVDSVTLLHILRQQPDYRLTVAHFDHGIRSDSGEDEKQVRQLARQYGLPYVYERAYLGASASEAVARAARYRFLHHVREAAAATAVITAHHQDDVLETAVMNIVRGTGRRGMTSLKSTDIVKRPLLHIPKAAIVRYARDNQLLWREDSTNVDTGYKRNYVRHNIMSRFSAADRQNMHDIIVGMRSANSEIDHLLDQIVADMSFQGTLQRRQFILLPHTVAREVMARWLQNNGVKDIDKKMLERLIHAAKTFAPIKNVHVKQSWQMTINKDYLALKCIER
ncbi:MAG TPA: tRNA lysidine(34) synthetase TilS [Candidatus Saccharimonadales bacterium]|jgi:tRNA(Ile)-lysidine synthetase-like protein